MRKSTKYQCASSNVTPLGSVYTQDVPDKKQFVPFQL